ncbi:MAG TPA: glycosidase, partial [Candidatus Limnocylindria bacterium]|nr:glycosidase [Candidatus Limnocylindria bacterium]
RTGLFNETVFSCGHVELGDGRIRMYYGAADSVVAAADFEVRDILNSLEPRRGAADHFVRV